MGEAKRRDRPPTVGTLFEVCARTAKHMIAGSPDRVVLLGPLVWMPTDGAVAKTWRFFTNSGAADGSVRLGKFVDETEEATEALRETLKAAFLSLKPPVQIIDCHTELALAELSALRWPSERSLQARENTAREVARQAALTLPPREV
jgi:hypothetical protein